MESYERATPNTFACNWRPLQKINYNERVPTIEEKMSHAPMCQESKIPQGRFSAFPKKSEPCALYGFEGNEESTSLCKKKAGNDNEEGEKYVVEANFETYTELPVVTDKMMDCVCGNNTAKDQCPPNICPQSHNSVLLASKYCSNIWDEKCDKYLEKAPTKYGDMMVRNVVNSYYRYSTKSPETGGKFVEKTVELCSARPGVCDEALDLACKGISGKYLDEAASSTVKDLCGCFLRDTSEYSEYDKYRGQVPKECDPYCKTAKVQRGFKNRVTDTNEKLLCKQSNCIMNDLSISHIKSQAGDLTLKQYCSGSAQTPLTCLIDGMDIKTIEAQLGGITLSQECKGGCLKKISEEEDQWVEVDCETGLVIPPKKSGEDEKKFFGRNYIYLIVAIILCIFLLIILFFGFGDD